MSLAVPFIVLFEGCHQDSLDAFSTFIICHHIIIIIRSLLAAISARVATNRCEMLISTAIWYALATLIVAELEPAKEILAALSFAKKTASTLWLVSPVSASSAAPASGPLCSPGFRLTEPGLTGTSIRPLDIQ